jgi:hypothetical protein
MLNTAPSKEHRKARTLTPSLKLFQAIINKFVENTEELFTSYLEKTGMAWWVEIVTKKPDCKYYFGPFASHREAQLSQLGYIESHARYFLRLDISLNSFDRCAASRRHIVGA